MPVSIESSHTAPAYRLVVGVDIAAATLTAVWTAPGTAPSRPLTVDQTPGGFATLQARLLATGVLATYYIRATNRIIFRTDIISSQDTDAHRTRQPHPWTSERA